MGFWLKEKVEDVFTSQGFGLESKEIPSFHWKKALVLQRYIFIKQNLDCGPKFFSSMRNLDGILHGRFGLYFTEFKKIHFVQPLEVVSLEDWESTFKDFFSTNHL